MREDELDKIENGLLVASKVDVESLSIVYGVPVELFYESDKTALEEFLEWQKAISAQVKKKERV